jgi:hypothetical protein
MVQEISVRLLPESFTLSRLPQFAELPLIISRGEMCFTFRTDEEFSIICPDFMAPANVQQETDFRGLKLEESINWSSIGVATQLTQPLAQIGVPILMVATHSSCIIFIKEDKLIDATKALQHAGIKFVHKE